MANKALLSFVMNRGILFVLAMMVGILTVSAQFSNTDNSGTPSVGVNGWNAVYAEWNPSSIVSKEKDSKSFNGFSLGYSHAFGLSRKMPFYLEAGTAVQYSCNNNFEEYSSLGLGVEGNDFIIKEFTSSWSYKDVLLKVPVNLMYRFDFKKRFALIPYIGLSLKGHIWGSLKFHSDYYDEDSESINIYNEKDMEGKQAKRIQLGWQLGLRAHFDSKFLVGASWGTDFVDYFKKSKIHSGSITIGYIF